MGCACTKKGEVAMIGYRNPAAVLFRPISSHVSHVRISTLTVKNQGIPNVYLGTLEEKLRVRQVTYRPKDYRVMLQDLRTQFFQYLDQRTVLQDDRGRPVSPRYRKAMDWKLYEKFEREFADELYRRRHENITREELTEIFETYIQSAHVTLRPEHLQNNEDDKTKYVSNILILPSSKKPSSTITATDVNVGIYVNGERQSDDESDSSNTSSQLKVARRNVRTTRSYNSSSCESRSRSRTNSTSSSSSGSHTKTNSRASLRSLGHSRVSSKTSSDDSESTAPSVQDPLIDYEANLTAEFQRISDRGISADEYILLLLLYTQALEELRNRSEGQEREEIVRNLENIFEDKRKIVKEKIEHEKRKREEAARVPDTKGYSQVVDKELKENESKLVKSIMVGTENNDNTGHEKLQSFINQQTDLIQKLEADRKEEIKRLEAEIAAMQTGKGDTSSIEENKDNSDEKMEKEEEKTVVKKVKKLYKKLEGVIMEDSENKKNIKKKLKNVRKKLKQSIEQVDADRLKRKGLSDKEHLGAVVDDEVGHLEDTDDYCKMADQEFLKDEDALLDHLKQIRILDGRDTETLQERNKLITEYVHRQSELMRQIEEDRTQLMDQTEKKLLNNKVDDLQNEYLKDIKKDLTDTERIRNLLEKHRQDHKDLAQEIDANRIRQRTLLQQRLKKLRQKEGRADELESETDWRDLIRDTDDFGNDIDTELTQETKKVMEQLEKLEDTQDNEQRRILLEQHLNHLADKFKRLDSDRQDIINDIERNVDPDSLLIDDMNREIIEDIRENSSGYDEDAVRRKLAEHRLRQKKFLEDLDSDRIQRKGLLARKLLQRKNKRTTEKFTSAVVPDTEDYCTAIDEELKRDEDELLDFLTKDTSVENGEGRQEVIAKRVQEHIGRQKELVLKLESERKERIKDATKEPSIDVPSKLKVLNKWFKNSFFDGSVSDESNVKDKLGDFRKRQKKLLEDVDSSRLQQRKRLQEKLQKLREEKESESNEDASLNTDELVKDIATMAGTNEDVAEEDIEFMKEIYKQKEQNLISEEELQKRFAEHFSKTRKMKQLIDEESKASKNKIKERKESIKRKREEEEENNRLKEEEEKENNRLKEKEEKENYRLKEVEKEQKEEEERKALSRAYRNNEMVKSSSLIRKHQRDNAIMSTVVEESKRKAKERIKEKKMKKNTQQNDNGNTDEELF